MAKEFLKWKIRRNSKKTLENVSPVNVTTIYTNSLFKWLLLYRTTKNFRLVDIWHSWLTKKTGLVTEGDSLIFILWMVDMNVQQQNKHFVNIKYIDKK